MANTTTNSSPLIKAQVFSEFMLEIIRDGFLPAGLYRDVTDFGDGTTLYIPVIGETVIRDYNENDPAQYDAIDTGQVSLVINQYKQGGSYITNKLKQDAYKAAALEAAIPREHLRKIKEAFETDLLAKSSLQTLSNANAFNGASHRFVASGTNNVLTIEDIAYMRYAFDKANMPDEGRIGILDPISELALNKKVADQAFINNPQFVGIVGEGFARDHRFVRNIFGFDLWVSNRLPRLAAETITGGPDTAARTSTAGDVGNVFMSVASDQHKPFMSAMRQMPKVDGRYNQDFQRDEYVITARWGSGLQRSESLGVIISSATLYK